MRNFVRIVGWMLACCIIVACTQSHPVSGTLLDGALGTGVLPDAGASFDGPDAASPAPGSSATGSPGLGCVDCQGADLFGLVQFPACCTADKKCGLDFAMVAGAPLCVERDAPGGVDPTCPATMVSMFTLPGCCRPDGTCGALSALVPLGCIGGEIAGLLPGGGGGGSAGSAPMTCTPSPL